MQSTVWSRQLNRRLTRRKALALTASAGVAVALACSSDSSNGGSTEVEEREFGSYTPAVGEPQPGGRFASRGFTTRNYNVFSRGAGGALTYDLPLSSREGERRYRLEALGSIETSDPLTVVMKLIPGQVYHNLAPVNGRAVKASDIVAGQEYVLNLPNAYDKTFQRDFLSRAEATDDNTVVYHLKKPSAYLYSVTALGSGSSQSIVPPETYGPALDTSLHVGSGPFFMDSSQLNVIDVLKKFPNWRGASKGLPYVDEYEIKNIPDTFAAEAAFRSGQIDEWGGQGGVPPTQAETLTKDLGSRIVAIKQASFQTWSWMMNMEKGLPWTKDARVREAFWRLTNRQQILDIALGSNGALSKGILPLSLSSYQLDPSYVTQKYDIEDVAKAKQLLSAANFDVSRDYDLMGQQPGSVLESGAIVWGQQLGRAGIKTRVNTVAGFAQLSQRWSDNDWELMVQTGNGNDTPSQALRNQHSKGWSDTFRRFALMDPEIDSLIEKSETTVNVEENIKLVKQAQTLCIERFTSFYNILTQDITSLINSRVQHYEITLVDSNLRVDFWLKQS